MIASSIGNSFLKAFNRRYNKNYTPKEFFEKEYFPLFFDHPKYMQWITNSPFVQMKQGQKVHLLHETERADKLENLQNKIRNGFRDASVGIGFPAAEESEYATTSGLVSDINVETEEAQMYLSWIGGGLGVGVAGGFSVFFNHPEILLTVYKGWSIYRKILNDEAFAKLRGNQINSWNGQWLHFAYSMDFEEDPDAVDIQEFFKISKNKVEVDIIFWSRLFFNLSQYFTSERVLGYIYSLGQTNKTLGFIPFQFHEGKSVMAIYRKLFGDNDALNQKKDYERLFGVHIRRAAELGAIGLQALQPQKLREYFHTEKLPDFKGNSEKKQYENLIFYRTYKTWLLAMITKNKQEDLHYSEKVAQALLDYRQKAKKTDRGNLIEKQLLPATSKKHFFDALSSLIQDVEDNNLGIFKELRDKLHLMNKEEFGYFLVLLKFDYKYLEREKHQ